MALRRFWIEKEDLGEGEFQVRDDLFHHLVDVCRVGQGHRFELLPGDGKAYLVEVIGLGKRDLTLTRISERDLAPLPEPYIHLFVSIPRWSKLDEIMEKSVELGVKTLTPFVSEFSFIRKPGEISSNRRQRFEKIIKGATRQCGRGDLMELGEIRPLNKILEGFNQVPGRVGLFPFEGVAAKTLKEGLRSLKVQSPKEVCVFVGSEGGFSEREVLQFQDVGMEPLTLGEQVLRVETACLALVSILKYELNL